MYWMEQFPEILKFPVNGADFRPTEFKLGELDMLEAEVTVFETVVDDSDLVDIHKILDIFFCISTDATA